MSLERLEPCCSCPDHQRPYRNEDGWIITGLPEASDTWEAWTAEEWRGHCLRCTDTAKVRRSKTASRYYQRNRGAA